MWRFPGTPRFRSSMPSRSACSGTLKPSFSAGVQSVSIDGVAVRIYSPEKSIADCFKYRNKIGIDVSVQALRAYRERTKKPDLKLISRFAAVDRVEKVMRPYLEAVL